MLLSIISLKDPWLILTTGTPTECASIATSPKVSYSEVWINNFDLFSNSLILLWGRFPKNSICDSRFNSFTASLSSKKYSSPEVPLGPPIK